MTTDISAFLAGGAVRVPFVSTDVFGDLQEGYRRLLAEPGEVKAMWEVDFGPFPCEPPRTKPDPDDGLVRRDKDDTRSVLKDEKYYFHYRPRLVRELERRGVQLDRYREWLGLCDVMLKRTVADGMRFARQLDSMVPGLGFEEGMAESDQHVVRLVQYDPPLRGGMVGKPHRDRAGITYHVAETYPGLRGPKGALLPATPDWAQVFPGLKMEGWTKGEIPAMWHWAEGRAGEARGVCIVFLHVNIDISDLLAERAMR